MPSTADTFLFTDFYSLTMSQGYFKFMGHDEAPRRAVFEMFFRRQPYNGGYAIFAGLGTLLQNLSSFTFSGDDITYLKSLGLFEDDFLDYLKNFHFSGSLWAVDEGSVVFPNEPLIRIEGNLIECQLIEGMILNTINFQSLIATKTRRIWLASGKGSVMEFGLRRAHGVDGALSASRAAWVGGVIGTSNTLAGKLFNIPVIGTMAHSWVMSFPSEKEAFDTYAEIYPDNSVFLIDTYNTLKSGIHNAILAGKKLAEEGKNFGVRLDSGDIQYLSAEVRKILDEERLNKVKITVSNELDESIIETLVKSNVPVDTWGVGTSLVTGGRDSSFTGVYKLSAYEDSYGQMMPVMKFSDNPDKTTNPGIKQVWRISDKNGSPLADILALDEELRAGGNYCFWHPSADWRHFYHVIENEPKPLLKKHIENGVICNALPSLEEIRSNSLAGFESFDATYKRLLNPHLYKVSITEKLRKLKLELINRSA